MVSSIQPNGESHSLDESTCTTTIINLRKLEDTHPIPDRASALELRQLYHTCVNSSPGGNAQQLQEAIESFRAPSAPPIAFPTETVYGLGADATNPSAIKGIFTTKGRPSDNPLIVHVASLEQLEQWTSQPLPEAYTTLVQDFWPGPLTILLPVPHNSRFAPNVHPGQKAIGFRIPSSKYARFVIAAADRPIAAPSANTSGRPSPTTAQHVFHDLNGKIDWILDGGRCDVGLESTVVDGLSDPPVILRPGGISLEALIDHGVRHGNAWSRTREGYTHHQHESTGNVEKEDEDAPRAPGMKYRHYTPNGKLILFNTPVDLQAITSKLDTALSLANGNCRIGIIDSTPSKTWLDPCSPFTSSLDISAKQDGALPDPWASHSTICTYGLHTIYILHVGSNINTIAQKLFDMLRLFDHLDCDIILANSEAWTTSGSASKDKTELRDALKERIEKAAFEIVD